MLFRSAKDKARLVVDLAGVNARRAAVKVTVNGRSARYDLNGTSDSAAYGRQTAADERVVELPLTADDLRCGGNSVTITVLEGSWIVFDHVRLEATRGVKMAPLHRDFFVRSVAAAPYELLRDGVRVQPLLVDTEVLGRGGTLGVKLDGREIYSCNLDTARYELEVPMPVVTKHARSRYQVVAGGVVVAEGVVTRSPQPLDRKSVV